MTTPLLPAVETIDTRGNITRHAAHPDGRVRCGRGGTVDVNHSTATINSTLDKVQCRRCVRLVEHDRFKLAARFRRKSPRLML